MARSTTRPGKPRKKPLTRAQQWARGHDIPFPCPSTLVGRTVPGKGGGKVTGCATPSKARPREGQVWIGPLQGQGHTMRAQTARRRIWERDAKTCLAARPGQAPARDTPPARPAPRARPSRPDATRLQLPPPSLPSPVVPVQVKAGPARTRTARPPKTAPRERTAPTPATKGLWRGEPVTDASVRERASLFWSPRQHAYDPRMMGNSSATTLAPQMFRDFCFDLASEFYFSPWNKTASETLQKTVLASGHSNARNLATNLGWLVFNPSAGSEYPSQRWDARHSSRLRDLQALVPQLDEAKLGPVAKEIRRYLADVETVRQRTEDQVATAVVQGLEKMGLDARLIGNPRE